MISTVVAAIRPPHTVREALSLPTSLPALVVRFRDDSYSDCSELESQHS